MSTSCDQNRACGRLLFQYIQLKNISVLPRINPIASMPATRSTLSFWKGLRRSFTQSARAWTNQHTSESRLCEPVEKFYSCMRSYLWWDHYITWMRYNFDYTIKCAFFAIQTLGRQQAGNRQLINLRRCPSDRYLGVAVESGRVKPGKRWSFGVGGH